MSFSIKNVSKISVITVGRVTIISYILQLHLNVVLLAREINAN